MLKIAFSETYAHHLPEKHRFPMLKYELLPKQLLHEGVVVRVLLAQLTAPIGVVLQFGLLAPPCQLRGAGSEATPHCTR